MSSKVAYSTYSYAYSPARGDVGTATYAGGSSGDVITASAGVVTQWVNPVTSSTEYLPGDTKVFYFKNGAGNNRAIVMALQWDSSYNPVCYFMIFNADTWGSGSPVYGPAQWSVTDQNQTTVSIVNPYKFQRLGVDEASCYIYGIDYDNKVVFRLLSSGTNGDTYSLQSSGFSFDKLTTVSEAHGVDLVVQGNYVYALFISGDNLTSVSTASYKDSTLIKLNPDFSGTPAYKGPHGSQDVAGAAKNAFSIQAYGDYLYLAAIGGPQQAGSWNPGSRIQKVALSDLAVTDLLRAATTAEAQDYPDDCFDFRALTFSADGNQVFILTGKYSASYIMSWRLYATDMTTLAGTSNELITETTATFIADNSSLSGYLWALLYSETYGKTWFVRGNDLAIYSASGLVGNAAAIGSLSTLTSSPYLNSVTLYGGETAVEVRELKGYVAPAFASNSTVALIERKKLLGLMGKNRK